MFFNDYTRTATGRTGRPGLKELKVLNAEKVQVLIIKGNLDNYMNTLKTEKIQTLLHIT